jgi:DNA repair exonuclease SbcCD nuclease subunit
MKIKIIGDIHQGKKFPYTTQKSSITFEALHSKILAKHTTGKFLQLGDLFDNYSVSDRTLVQGYRWMENCAAALSGNHDVSTNIEKPSAIKLLKDELGVNVIWKDVYVMDMGATRFHFVPHQLTQSDFDACLDNLKPKLGAINVLILHCNFGNREGVITENYLRYDVAKRLTKNFLIISGHEHNMSKPMDKVIMLGSIMPFSFGEMKDKYILEYDYGTGEHELINTWSSANYAQLSYEEFLERSKFLEEFVEVTGRIEVSQAAEINKKIAFLYKNTDVVAIKNSTAIYRHEKEAGDLVKAEDWLDQVRKQCSKEQELVLDELLGEL